MSTTSPPPARKSVHILGVSAFYHDSAACLVRDGQIIGAAQEEPAATATPPTLRRFDWSGNVHFRRPKPGLEMPGSHRKPSEDYGKKTLPSRELSI